MSADGVLPSPKKEGDGIASTPSSNKEEEGSAQGKTDGRIETASATARVNARACNTMAQKEAIRKSKPNIFADDSKLDRSWYDMNDHDRKVKFELFARLKQATPAKMAAVLGVDEKALNAWVHSYYGGNRRKDESYLSSKIKMLQDRGEMFFYLNQMGLAQSEPSLCSFVGKAVYGQKEDSGKTELDLSDYFNVVVKPKTVGRA
jgi:hypothetical protein